MELRNLVRVVEVFADESLDISAKGLLRVLHSNDIDLEELIIFLLPRDYDPPVSNIQLGRIRDRLREVFHD